MGNNMTANRAKDEIRRHMAIDLYLGGTSKRAAMKEAGYSHNSVHVANQWFNQPYVIRVINERRDALMKNAELSQEWIVKRLMRIADVSIGELLEIDPDGNLVPNYLKMTDDMRKNIVSFEADTTYVGRGKDKKKTHKVKVRSADQLSALSKLMSILGIDKKVHEVHSMSDTARQLMEGRQRILGDLDAFSPTEGEEDALQDEEGASLTRGEA